VVDEDMAPGHTDLEELGEGMADIGYTEEYVLAAWIAGDRIEDSYKVNLERDTAAIVDMDNNTAAVVDMEGMVMAIAVTCVVAQSQIAFLQQERLLDAEAKVEAEAEPLCWRLVEEYWTAAGMLCTVEAGVTA
jgi:hypothetical protein